MIVIQKGQANLCSYTPKLSTWATPFINIHNDIAWKEGDRDCVLCRCGSRTDAPSGARSTRPRWQRLSGSTKSGPEVICLHVTTIQPTSLCQTMDASTLLMSCLHYLHLTALSDLSPISICRYTHLDASHCLSPCLLNITASFRIKDRPSTVTSYAQLALICSISLLQCT